MSTPRARTEQSPALPREAVGHSTPQDTGVKKGLQIGLFSGLVAITCCVSPVVLVLIGVATAAEAVALGDTLYYTYGWFFRGAGILWWASRCSFTCAAARVAAWMEQRATGGCC